MLLTYRYQLRPTRAQYALLDELCERQRLLYNGALQERRDAWAKARVSIGYNDQQKALTEIRAADVGYSDVPVALSRWTLRRVDDAMKGFFSRVKRGDKPGFPRFRAMGRWQTFGFAEWSGVRLVGARGDRLLFKPLATGIRVSMHRPLLSGDLRSATQTRRGRRWFVQIVVDVPVAEAHARPGTAVGVDVGVLHLATTSEGAHVSNVRIGKAFERRIRIAARALARARRASRRRRIARERLASLRRRVAAARSTHLHMVSAALAARYDLIVVEDLRLADMTRSAKGTADAPGTNVRAKAGLNREMLDAAPGTLVRMLTYKAERAGGTVVAVDPRNTSRDCSSCGASVPKALSERRHRCACGADLDRDVNAALNILSRGLSAPRPARGPGDANVGHRPVRRLETACPKAA